MSDDKKDKKDKEPCSEPEPGTQGGNDESSDPPPDPN